MYYDNSDIRQKIMIRNNLFSYHLNKDICIEYFAGEGVLTKMFWANVCKNVICVEKEQSKINKINLQNVTKYIGNNIDFIELSENIEIIDCDAYGLVTDFIRKILEVSKTKQKIIFFTDGFFKVQKKLKHLKYNFEDIVKSLYPDKYFYEKALGGNVYYGYLYYNNL